jgi:hypothetical protein
MIAVVAGVALTLSVLALGCAVVALLVERRVETQLTQTIARVDAWLAGVTAEQANADRMKDQVRSHATKVWSAPPGSWRGN